MPTANVPQVYVPPDGPITARVMLVGEAPGIVEVKMKRGFVGPSGDELWNIIYKYANMSRRDMRVTNLFKWPLEVPESRITQPEWQVARQMLIREIMEGRPQVIVTLGAIATHGLLPETRGRDMETVNALPHNLFTNTVYGYNPIVIPSYHPAASFRDSSKLQFLINAIREMKRILYSGEGSAPFGLYTVPVHTPLYTTITPIREQINDRARVVALDTETYRQGGAYIVSASSVEGQATVIERPEKSVTQTLILANHVANPRVTTLLHNALFDLPILADMGIVPARWIDTMTVAFLIQCLPLSLKELGYRLLYTLMREYKEVVGDYVDLSFVPDEESVYQYAAGDPSVTLQIHNRMLPMWYDRMEETLQVDMDIQPMVVAMVRRGFGIDQSQLQTLDATLDKDNTLRLLKIQTIASKLGFTTPVKSGKNKGMTFNPRSSDQLAELMYEKLRLGADKKIKKSALTGKKSTNKKILAQIKGEHPIVQMVIDYKETATLRTSFLKSLQQHIVNGRIHADIGMTRIPHSGRFTSTRPNLLAIPVRSENGRKIRNAFIATPGFTFISSDLSQIELRCLAHNTQDPVMLDIYRTNKDIHTTTAMNVFSIRDPKQLDDYRHRLPAKTCNFLICNLGTAYALSRELISAGAGDNWTPDECQMLIDSWFRIYPKVRESLDETGRRAYSLGFITDMFGRRELLPQFQSCNEKTREEGIRIACNQQIQSSAQGIIKRIMRNIWVKFLRELMEQDIAYPILQLHDDIVIECREEYASTLVPMIQYEMENSIPEMTVPILVGIKVGRIWGSQEKIKI